MKQSKWLGKLLKQGKVLGWFTDQPSDPDFKFLILNILDIP